MNEQELIQLAERAQRMAYRVRYEQPSRGDTEQVARAWERLGQAAYSLEAICSRRFTFDPPRRTAQSQPSTASLGDYTVLYQG
jgi:hypothetical protein